VLDAAPEVRVALLVVARERDHAVKLAALRGLDEQRERWRPVAGGVQHAGNDPDVQPQHIGVVRLAGLDAGEHACDDLRRPLAPQRLPVIAVVGARVKEDERDTRRRGQVTKESLGVRVAFLIDEEQRGLVFDDAASRGS
jgi:hypothetical protein